jgi:uncharacterized Fe-S cluster-containing radical SAM superfamily enzyme
LAGAIIHIKIDKKKAAAILKYAAAFSSGQRTAFSGALDCQQKKKARKPLIIKVSGLLYMVRPTGLEPATFRVGV